MDKVDESSEHVQVEPEGIRCRENKYELQLDSWARSFAKDCSGNMSCYVETLTRNRGS